MKTKLSNHSVIGIKSHVTTILESHYDSKIHDLRISPRKTGNCVLARFRTNDDPTTKRSRLFGTYRGDVWIEGPCDPHLGSSTNDAA
ncbi:MAG: hypothetical protein ABI600_17225 [Luteolibacter sp.]